MPYGLPSAIKLSRPAEALEWDSYRHMHLPAGTIVEPLHPAADQDGWNGHWKCRTADGKTVAIPGEMLRF